MTSLLPSSASSSASSARARAAADARRSSGTAEALRHRRPLVPVAVGGGLVAAGAPLLVFAALGVVGWFLTDGGAHGAPRDGLRVGALGWLLGHGSGVHVEGVPLTAVPLGVTLVCAWAVWRVALRVGDSVSGHGPDAHALADGERDWTVPVVVGCFGAAYVALAVLVTTVVATPATDPSARRVVTWSLLLVVLVAAPAVAVGAGRAAGWAARVPAPARDAVVLVRRLVVAWLAVSAVALVAALVADLDTAANLMSQLHPGTGEGALLVVLMVLVLPNATLFAGSYLLGPGFTVGTGTLVTPQAAVVGALPMFPLLAALPDGGPAPGWTSALLALPLLVAAVVAARVQRSRPTVRWDEGALRGCAGGVGAGLVLGLLAAVAGGAVGPGRMRDVGPLAGEVTLHAVTTFGIGGLLGGLAMTWWQRRRLGAPAAATDAD